MSLIMLDRKKRRCDQPPLQTPLRTFRRQQAAAKNGEDPLLKAVLKQYFVSFSCRTRRTAAGAFTTTTPNGRLVRTVGPTHCAFVQSTIGLLHSALPRSTAAGVFGYGTGAGGGNELCRGSIVSCAFVGLCSIQKAITCIYVPTRKRVVMAELKAIVHCC